MSNFWFKDYKKVNDLAIRLSETIKKIRNEEKEKNKNTIKRPFKERSGKETAVLRGQLAQLTHEITQLSQSLVSISSNPSAYGATTNDLSKMGDLVNLLQSKREELLDDFKMIFVNNLNNPYAEDVEKNINSADTTTNSGNMSYLSSNEEKDSNIALKSYSNSLWTTTLEEKMLRQQDEQLDFLEGSVQNLKSIGNNINDEVSLHYRLLGDIDISVDEANSQISRNKHRLKRLMTKTGNFGLILIIILLVILLAFLFFL